MTNALDEALAKLADGEPVDWAAMEQHAVTPADREMLQQLRILAGLEEVHKSTPLVGSGTEPPTTDAEAHTRVAAGSGRHGRKPPLRPTAKAPEPGGQRWGRYRLVRLLGQGGYGAVYLARDDELDCDIAIKLLHQSLVAQADLAQRVKAEGRALARVRKCPNVVTVYGVEEHEGQLGLCMEYIHGRTLDDIVREDGPLNANEAMVVGQDVCRGLAAVHAAGVIHRDVKARNVIRERAGRIVLMDLGAGALTGPDDETGPPDTVGTPVYMAPEILGGGFPTPRSDVYAVGVLLYFLSSGNYPVVGATIDEIRALHKRRSRVALDERRPDLPEAFVRVVERATAHDVAERPESAVALLRALSEALEPTPIPPPPLDGNRRAWLHSVKLVAATVAGLVLFATCSGLLTTWHFNNTIARPSAFAADSLPNIVLVGFSSMVVPSVVIGALLGGVTFVQLLLKPFHWPRRIWRRFTEWVLSSHASSNDEHVTYLAQAAVFFGFLGLGLIFAAHRDVLFAFAGSLTAHDLNSFAPFRPEGQVRRGTYQLATGALLFLVMVGWYSVRRIRISRNATIPGWVRGAGVALVTLLLLFSQAPYKAMYRNIVPVVLVEGSPCYALGKRGEDLRVYCPTWSPPRVRTVSTSRVSVQSCGFEQNVFLLSLPLDCTQR